MNIQKLKYSHIISIEDLSENPIIIDGGACHGNFADIILNINKNSKIILVEPCLNNIKILEDKYNNNINIQIFKNVLTGEDSDETVEFSEFIGLEEWGNAKNLYTNVSPKPVNLKEIIKYKVKTLKIDNLIKLLKNKGHIEIDYMKLDVEGYEQEIIRSMYICNINNIKQISMEIHNNVDLYYIYDQLRAIGYKTIVFSEGELYASMSNL